MSTRFHHLNVPQQWQTYWSKYPEGYTILEALIQWVQQVDNMVDNVNDWNIYLEKFVQEFDKNLQKTVTDVLREWYESGFLGEIITEAMETGIKRNTDHLHSMELNAKYPPVGVTAVKGGGVDDSEAIRNLLAYATENGYATLYFPPGTYNFDEVTLTAGYFTLKGAGRNKTTFKPFSPNKYVIKLASDRNILSDFTIDGTDMEGTKAIGIAPADENQISTIVHTNHNLVERVLVSRCAEGAILRNGPDVGGVDSGCWYNTFQFVDFENCVRSIWLRDGTNAGSSPANRNKFIGVRVNNGNIGVQIDAGDTNTFSQCSFNSVSEAGIHTITPTAIKINYRGITGYDNLYNRFSLCSFEANTVDLHNDAVNTELYGCNTGFKKIKGERLPAVVIGANVSGAPLILPGLKYAEANTLDGIKSGVWNIEKPINDIGYDWKKYDFLLENTSNITSFSNQKESSYMVLSGMVDWHLRCNFQATAATAPIKLVPPVAPDPSLYKNHGSTAPLTFPVSINDGTNDIITHAFFDATTNHLTIKAPPNGWYLLSVNNRLGVVIRYRKQA